MRKLMEKIGVEALAFIEENIRRGFDYEGNKFSYSTRPFFRPWHPVIQRKLGGKEGEGKYYKTVFSKTTGAAGMIILGGYKEYKKMVYPDAADKFLTVKGKMLRSMNAKATDNEAAISFSDPEESQKAYWFNVSGVGRSRKLWKFLGVTKQQLSKIEDMVRDEYIKIAQEELAKFVSK